MAEEIVLTNFVLVLRVGLPLLPLLPLLDLLVGVLLDYFHPLRELRVLQFKPLEDVHGLAVSSAVDVALTFIRDSEATDASLVVMMMIVVVVMIVAVMLVTEDANAGAQGGDAQRRQRERWGLELHNNT